jgi:hypothetical protein
MKPIFVVNPENGTVDKVYKNIGSRTGVGYRHTRINGTHKLIHRVIWEHVNGPIPKGMHIDHINGVKDDNRISNLRLVTPMQNAQNRPTTKGVSWCKRTNKWLAQIGHDNKRINLGRFEFLADAEAAYAEAAAKYHTHNPKSAKENASGVSRGGKGVTMRRLLATAITNEASV